MQRVTITVDDKLLAEIDQRIEAHIYQDRSKAFRDLARVGLKQPATSDVTNRPCEAVLIRSCGDDGEKSAKRSAGFIRDRHHLIVSTLCVFLDRSRRLEITVLKGLADDVRQLVMRVSGESAVKNDVLVVLPEEVGT